MYCRLCKNEAEHVDLGTRRVFCNETCFSEHATYKEWKTSLPIQEHRETEKTSDETFEDIIMRTGGFPLHAAHRGGGFEFAPENTIYAFKKCLSYGVRLFELDLRRTKDNVLVLLHWSTVDETTDGTGPVDSYTLAELSKLDAAVHHPTLKGTGIRVPTFKEFLDEFVPVKDLLFFFDFKDSLTLRMALKFIEPYNIGNRFALGSVVRSTNNLILSMRASRNVPVCTDVIQTFRITIDYMLGLLDCYEFVHDIYGFVLCKATSPFWGQQLVEAIHKQGKRVTVSSYGEELNKPERLMECIAYGVDYILCDRPDLLQPLLEEAKRGRVFSVDTESYDDEEYEEEEYDDLFGEK